MADPQLRAWRTDDADALLDALNADPQLHRQLGGYDSSAGSQGAAVYIGRHLVPGPGRLCFAVVLAGRAVGGVAVTAIDRRHGTGWVSDWLAPSARGQGAASRGLTTVADLALADGLFRLELGHRTNNPASCRVATAAGFRVEGLERAKLRYGDRRFDVEAHARLATDPEPSVQRLAVI